MEARIVQNALRVKSVDKIYWSRHRHDFIRFETADGPGMLDGGTEYIRHGIDPGNTDVEWLDINEDTPLEEAAKRLVGIRGEEYVLASKMTHQELVEMRERLTAFSRTHPMLLTVTDHLIQTASPVLDRILED